MTLLALESQQIHERFDDAWAAWQARHEWTPTLAGSALAPTHNHFTLALYEYFPQASLQAVRELAAASRALSYFALLCEAPPAAVADEQLAAARDWLFTQALAAWRAAGTVPAGDPMSAERWRDDYLTALAEDRRWLTQVPCTYGHERFLSGVSGAAIPARMTVRMLAEAAGAPAPPPALIESQLHLYAGLRLTQQAVSWKNDYLAGAWTYVLAALAEVAHLERDLGEQQRAAAVAELARHFYYSGLAERLLGQAGEHFCRAMAAVTELPPTGWGAMLAVQLERTQRLVDDISKIRTRNMTRLGASREPAAAASRDEATLPDSAARALLAAARYLTQQQEPDGGWGDFLLLAEQSTFWVTGYVGWSLSGSAGVEDSDLARAARRLVAQRSPGGGWGYNSHWPQDADSIAHVILFLSRRGDVPREAWSGALAALLAHQSADGGFATIMDPEAWLSRFRSKTEDLSGWTCSHACVTGVIALLLWDLDGGAHRPAAARALGYLRASQRPEGYWDAYWWQGPYYTTARAVQALVASGEPGGGGALGAAHQWLLNSQRADGSWTTVEGEPGQAFHSALALQALAPLSSDADSRAALARGLSWLLETQQTDGSWAATPMLRVPRPNMLRPWEHTAWRTSIVGLDVVVPDWHRVFTTATAIQAIRAVSDRLGANP